MHKCHRKALIHIYLLCWLTFVNLTQSLGVSWKRESQLRNCLYQTFLD